MSPNTATEHQCYRAMIPFAASKHQRCGDKPAQRGGGGDKWGMVDGRVNGLGSRTNAHSPEGAAQRDDTRYCPALSGLSALLESIPRALPWAGLYRAFGPAITMFRTMKNRTTCAGRQIGVLSRMILWIGLLCCCGAKANAAAIVFTFDNINRSIPDDSPLGLNDSRAINTAITMILKVTISLAITGDFNGDLYAQVTHGSGFSVLLNRVGRTATNEFGYGDAGLDITLSDDAAAGDVHVYRTTLFGNENTPVAGMLTGVWAPDARITDPDIVLPADPRSALLSSFNGLNPNGTWTLFIADASGGGQSTLQKWSVSIEGVPEPGSIALLVSGGGLLMSAWRRHRTTE